MMDGQRVEVEWFVGSILDEEGDGNWDHGSSCCWLRFYC